MNLVKSLVVFGLMFSGAQAFAHKDGPCKTYFDSCKDTKGKKEKMECVKTAAAADTANGAACTADLAKHEAHHKAKKDAAATDSAPATSN